MKVHNVIQGSEEWFRLRAPIPTSSEFHRILTPRTEKPSESQTKFMYELVAARLAPDSVNIINSPANGAIGKGIELEPRAISAYEFHRECEVERVGFVTTDDGTMGCSPDGLVNGRKGSVQFKCPQAAAHIGYELNPKELAMDYRCQLHGELFICELDFVDVVSFYGGRPLVIHRVVRDDFTEKLRLAVTSFCIKLKELEESLRAKG